MDRRDRGAALILALLTTLLLAGVGLSLTMMGDTERRIAYNFQTDRETGAAARAALARAVLDLAPMTTWDVILTGAARSSFADSTRQPRLPTAETVDLDVLTSDLQAATGSFGVNTPVWRLFAWGLMNQMVPAAPAKAGAYLAIWVADDTEETDGNPLADANGALLVHAEAFGPGGGRRAADALLKRAAGGIQIVVRRES